MSEGDAYTWGSPQSSPVLDPMATDATIMGLLKGFLGASDAIYNSTFSAVGITAAQDVFEIVAPSTKRVKLRGIYLNQYSDFGDAQAEILSVTIVRGFTTTGSGGSTLTPAPARSGGAAAGATVKANNTTVAVNGTGVVLVADGWNVAAGWLWVPTPQEQIWIAASERLVCRITAPADSLTCNGTLIHEEIT